MNEDTLWNKELDGETYAVSYSKAALWERFYGTHYPFRLLLANGDMSDEIHGLHPYKDNLLRPPRDETPQLKDGDLTRPDGEVVPHLKVVAGDDLKVVIQFVDISENEWSDEFRRETKRWLEQCLAVGARFLSVKAAGPDDVRAMFAPDFNRVERVWGEPYHIGPLHRFRQSFLGGFMPFARNAIRRIPNPRKRERLQEAQEEADVQLLDLMRIMVLSSPTVRQEFARMLEELNTLESVYPMSVANRLAAKLVEIRGIRGDGFR